MGLLVAVAPRDAVVECEETPVAVAVVPDAVFVGGLLDG